jgi:hypothetical protein
MKSYADLRERTLAMTGFFETSSGYPQAYGTMGGNHDGMGCSYGVLQYNFGTGSLQPLLNYMNDNFNQMCRDIFGTDYAEFESVLAMTIPDQVSWGASITNPQNEYTILEPWKTHFMNLGTTQECIDKQVTYSEGWVPNAIKWFNTLGLYSRRGFALCWDISVQQGRLFSLNQIIADFNEIDPTGKTRAQIEEEKLRIICERTSWDNRPSQFSQTVYDRKMMLINGTGDYFGATFDMAQYDLNYDPAFEGGIFSEIPTAGKPIVEVTNLYNAVRLDWEPTEYTASYKVYRATDPANLGITLTEITDGTTTFTDTTAIGGNTYYYTVKALNEFNNRNSDKMTGIPSSVLTYENKLVDFTGYNAWTVYGDTQAISDFGNINQTVQGGDRLKIDTSERLRFELPIGMVGSANTGGIIKAGIVPKNEYTLEYEIRFDSGFPWSKGGKVAGISGGKGYTGGEGALARTGDGWSVRMMWREDGRIIPYVYHYEMTGDFGDTFGDTLGYFTDTKPYKIKYYVKLNTGSDKNGILRIWMDDVQIYNKEDLIYRTDDSKIDTCHVSIFAGGSTEDWNMTGTGYIRLSYINWM